MGYDVITKTKHQRNMHLGRKEYETIFEGFYRNDADREPVSG